MQPGFQERFSACAADGAVGGGGAGVGKSAGLLIEPLRWVHLPGFTGLILRRDQRDLERPGGLWPKAQQLYPAFGAELKSAEYLARFESGATIQFGYYNPKTYEEDFQGPELGYLGLDELTHFPEKVVQFLIGRLRSPALQGVGVRPYWRATVNPDRRSWVRRLVDWWVAQPPGPGYAIPERAGVLRYYLRRGGQMVWGDTREELLAQFPRTKPEHVRSFTYVPGKLSENRFLGADYEGALLELDEHLQARLIDGDWNAEPPSGALFRSDWLKELAAAPAGGSWLWVWDLAATAEAEASTNSSFTAGLLMGLVDGKVVIADAEIGRWDAAEVEERVVRKAQETRDLTRRVRICRERAGAGKAQLEHYVRLLQGFDVVGDVESGEKEVRLRPLVAQARHGHFGYVRGPWNETFKTHLLGLPSRPDDVGDAASAGYADLAELGAPFSEAAVEAVVAANPALITPGGSAPRFGAAPRTGVGGGRFRLK